MRKMLGAISDSSLSNCKFQGAGKREGQPDGCPVCAVMGDWLSVPSVAVPLLSGLFQNRVDTVFF